MKLIKDKCDACWYLHFTDNSFVHAINDWEQVFGRWNWYSMHILHIYLENDGMTGGFELEFVVLGLGFRFRWNYAFEESETGKRLAQFEKSKK